jgi:hypothetical protein
MSSSPSFIGELVSTALVLNSTTEATLYTAGASGGECHGIWVNVGDGYTGGGNIELLMDSGNGDVRLGQRAIVAGDSFELLDGYSCRSVLSLQSGAVLKVKLPNRTGGDVGVAMLDGGDW